MTPHAQVTIGNISRRSRIDYRCQSALITAETYGEEGKEGRSQQTVYSSESIDHKLAQDLKHHSKRLSVYSKHGWMQTTAGGSGPANVESKWKVAVEFHQVLFNLKALDTAA